MKRNAFLAAALLCLCAAPAFAQTKKATPAALFNAFFNIEVGKSPLSDRPSEESYGVWNRFSSEKDGFTVIFPSHAEEIWTAEHDKISSFETETAKAHYSVMRMKFPSLLDNRQLNVLGEKLFAETLDAKTTNLISEKNICLDGVTGKELIYEEVGKIFFTRFYILEQKLFMLSVSLPKADYSTEFDYWAMKFLNSFGARIGSSRHIG